MNRASLRLVATVGAFVAVLWTLSVAFPAAWPRGILTRGAVTGIAAGVLAVGLVLTFSLTRVINFAYGAMGSAAAGVGLVVFQVAGLPWWVCVAIALASGAAIGFGVDLLLRRFEDRSRLVLTVATIGLLQILVGIQFAVAYYSGARILVPPFPNEFSPSQTTIGTSVFDLNDLFSVAVAPMAIGFLGWFLYRTDMGRAVRAIADNGERASLLGIPKHRVTRLVWVIAGVLTAAVMILNSPRNGLPGNPFVSTAGVFMPALVAAVLARMSSLPIAFGAGVGFGVLNEVIGFNIRKASVGTVVLLIAILIALLGRRWTVSRAEQSSTGGPLGGMRRPLPAALAQLPELRWGSRAVVSVVAAVAVVYPMWAQPQDIHVMSGHLVVGLAVLSIVVLTGWSGVVSLGQFAVVGAGAVVAGNLIVKLNVDLFLALVAAAVAGAVLGVLLAAPALRVTPMFVAVTTIAFATAMDQYFLNPTNYRNLIPEAILQPVLWKRFQPTGATLYYLCLGMLALGVLLVTTLGRARPGRVVPATRDNDRSVAAMSIAPTRIRVGAMALSGTLAGVAGGLWAVLQGGIGASSFPPQMSVTIFSIAVIGGVTSVSGSLSAILVLEAVIALLGVLTPQSAQLTPFATGALMLIVLLVFPGGLGQAMEVARDKIAGAAGRRRGISVEVGTAAGSAEIASAVEPSPADAEPVNGSTTGDSTEAAISMRGITAHYGPLQVLFGVDLAIRPGEILALLGTNGAGKSTLLRVLVGLLPASDGTLTWNRESIVGAPTDELARRGITLMPGGRGLFPTLSVDENLRLSLWNVRHDPGLVESGLADAYAVFPVLRDRSSQPSGNLSGGEQQQLSLAMALATKPQVLLIDELSLGLAPTIVGMLCQTVRDVNRDGTTIVVVEQSVNVALQLAERAIFLEKGAVRFEGPTADLLDRPDVLRSVFIGGGSPEGPHDDDGTFEMERVRSAPIELECRGITKHFGGITALNDIDITIEPGTIVGLIGHNGAGKTTLFDVLSGYLVPDSGSVRLGGQDVTGLTVQARARLGLGRSFQEARLYPSLTTLETVVIALERHLGNHDWFAASLAAPATVDVDAAAFRRARDIIDDLGLAGYATTPIADLSTGTRRIVELACIMAADPDVVLLDEPSGGVAQREAEAFGPLLRGLRDRTGCSIVIIEHDMSLLSGLCDVLVALDLGAVICTGTPDEVLSNPQVIASYLGSDPTAIARSGNVPRRRPRRGQPLRSG